jgi:hypothetical protein
MVGHPKSAIHLSLTGAVAVVLTASLAATPPSSHIRRSRDIDRESGKGSKDEATPLGVGPQLTEFVTLAANETVLLGRRG